MIQLNMYLNELTNFLRTITIKDTLIAEQMLSVWVQDEFKELVSKTITAHPYYRNIMGEYILFDHKEVIPIVKDMLDNGCLFDIIESDNTVISSSNIKRKYGEEIGSQVINIIVSQTLHYIFPLSTNLSWFDDSISYTLTRTVPNKLLYYKHNTVPSVYSYDTKTKILFIKEFLYREFSEVKFPTTLDETKFSHEVILAYQDFLSGSIISPDDREPYFGLTFKTHDNTRTIYRIPQTRYNTLLSKYPYETGVIHAVAYSYPAQFETGSMRSNIRLAYTKLQNSENFALLTYDDSLLEKSERQSIVDCVSNTLDMIRRRYAVEGFCYENLYGAAHYYLVWQILYLSVFVQRITNIRTGYAHTYHIWRYLKSHGFEDYRDILSIIQQKFLYKNLPYLNKHKGTQHALELLDYVLLTMKHVSLQGKNLMQSTVDDLSEEDEEIYTEDTAKKYPSVRSIKVADVVHQEISEIKENPKNGFEKILHHLGENAGLTKINDKQEYEAGKIEKIDELYEKERESFLEYQDDYLFEKSTDRHTKLISYAPTSHMNTKFLELKDTSTISDLITIYTQFCAETILYLISQDRLKFTIPIQLVNSSRIITLPAADWIGMLFYALYRIDHVRQEKASDTEELYYYTHPPKYAQLQMPLKLDKVKMFDTFKWHYQMYRTNTYLTKEVGTYYLNIDEDFAILDSKALEEKDIAAKGLNFILRSTSLVKPENRVWICMLSTGDAYTLCYNDHFSWWNILDKDQNIIFRTAKMASFNNDLPKFTWFKRTATTSGYKEQKIYGMRFAKSNSKYDVEVLLTPQYTTFFSLNTLVEELDRQGLNYLTLYLAATHDESAVHRCLYDKLLEIYCIGRKEDKQGNPELYDISNIFDGESFDAFLSRGITQGNEDIRALQLVLESYDESNDVDTLYSRMIDTIIESMFPEDDMFLAVGILSRQERIKRLMTLFKSLTAYNLAYLNPTCNEIQDTMLSYHVSSPLSTYIRNTAYDYQNIGTRLTDKLHQVVKPTYLDQGDVLDCTFTLSDQKDEDLNYKQMLLDKIESVAKIITQKKVTKAKKKARLSQLGFSDTLVDAIMQLPVETIKSLRYTARRIYRNNVNVKVSIVDSIDTTNINVPDDMNFNFTEYPADTTYVTFKQYLK